MKACWALSSLMIMIMIQPTLFIQFHKTITLILGWRFQLQNFILVIRIFKSNNLNRNFINIVISSQRSNSAFYWQDILRRDRPSNDSSWDSEELDYVCGSVSLCWWSRPWKGPTWENQSLTLFDRPCSLLNPQDGIFIDSKYTSTKGKQSYLSLLCFNFELILYMRLGQRSTLCVNCPEFWPAAPGPSV